MPPQRPLRHQGEHDEAEGKAQADGNEDGCEDISRHMFDRSDGCAVDAAFVRTHHDAAGRSNSTDNRHADRRTKGAHKRQNASSAREDDSDSASCLSKALIGRPPAVHLGVAGS